MTRSDTPFLGLGKPAVGDVGWGEYVDEGIDALDRRIGGVDAAFLNVKDPKWGATGDGVTDDAAAIQAAIDYDTGLGAGSYAPAVFLPHGIYRIGTPLHLRGGTRLIGSGGYYHGGTRAAVLKCTGANTHLFEFNGSSNWCFEWLVFEDSHGENGDPTDTAFFATGSNGLNSGWYMNNCRFNWFLKAIDLSTNHGAFLINTIQNTFFSNSPVDFVTNSFFNYNTFFFDTFQVNLDKNGWHVPAVNMAGDDTGGNTQKQMNAFVGCRFESIRRQALRAGSFDQLSIRDCYFEAINMDDIANPRDPTQKLPAIDLVTNVGVAHAFMLDNCFFIIRVFDSGAVCLGSTDLTNGNVRTGIINHSQSGWVDLGIFNGVNVTGDMSTDRFLDGNLHRIEMYTGQLMLDGLKVYTGSGSPNHGYAEISADVGSLYLQNDGPLSQTLWTKEVGTDDNGWASIQTRHVRVAPTDASDIAVDASAADVVYLRCTLAARTIANPTNAWAGQTLTFIIFNNSGAATTTSWGDHYHFVASSAWADPSNAGRIIITFTSDDGTHFWETSRSGQIG